MGWLDSTVNSVAGTLTGKKTQNSNNLIGDAVWYAIDAAADAAANALADNGNQPVYGQTYSSYTGGNKLADYDSGEITDRERTAAKRQKDIAKYNTNTLTGVASYNKGSAQNLAAWNSDMQNKLAAENAGRTSKIAEYNAKNTADQAKRQLATYDMANKQNAALRDVQNKQTSRKSEAERFEAQRQLQNAATGLFGSMNQAMNSSTIGNTMKMLENRNDADNSVYWQTLQDNRNAIQNAYDESYNQNQIAKRDAAINALKALQDIQGDLSSNLGNIQGDLFANLTNIRGDMLSNLANIEGDLYANKRNLQGDLAANLNNINPNLYEAPQNIAIPKGGYSVSGSQSRISGMQNKNGEITGNPIYRAPGKNTTISALEKAMLSNINGITQNNATLLDYIMPANAEQSIRGKRNTMYGNDYYSALMNSFR